MVMACRQEKQPLNLCVRSLQADKVPIDEFRGERQQVSPELIQGGAIRLDELVLKGSQSASPCTSLNKTSGATFTVESRVSSGPSLRSVDSSFGTLPISSSILSPQSRLISDRAPILPQGYQTSSPQVRFDQASR